jgi:catechol-2,3-dioxygenase
LPFNIPSNKIEEALQWLNDRVQLLWIEDYESYIADFTAWHARSVYFKDPAGNILEFIARFDLHDTTSEPFSALQIRNISEIGIVLPTEKFDKEVNDLLQKFQMNYFSRQPPMKHFRAIGDDEGLLIVVPEHRNWYPTNIPGRIFPLAVKFEIAGKENQFLNLRVDEYKTFTIHNSPD